jgi:hypothetical protein
MSSILPSSYGDYIFFEIEKGIDKQSFQNLQGSA